MEAILLDLDGVAAAIPVDDASWLAEELSTQGADGMTAAIRLEDALEREVPAVSFDTHETRATLDALDEHYDELPEALRGLRDALTSEIGDS